MSAKYQYGEDKPSWNAEDGTPQAQARRVSGGYNIDPIPDIKPDAINTKALGEFKHEFIDMPREFKPRQQSIMSPGATVNIPMTPMAKVVLLMPAEDALWLRQTLHENRIEGNGSKIEVWEFDKDHHTLEMHIEEVVIRG